MVAMAWSAFSRSTNCLAAAAPADSAAIDQPEPAGAGIDADVQTIAVRRTVGHARGRLEAPHRGHGIQRGATNSLRLRDLDCQILQVGEQPRHPRPRWGDRLAVRLD